MKRRKKWFRDDKNVSVGASTRSTRSIRAEIPTGRNDPFVPRRPMLWRVVLGQRVYLIRRAGAMKHQSVTHDMKAVAYFRPQPPSEVAISFLSPFVRMPPRYNLVHPLMVVCLCDCAGLAGIT